MQKFAREKLMASFFLEVGFKLGSPLKMILQSELSSSEQEARSFSSKSPSFRHGQNQFSKNHICFSTIY